MVIDPAYWRGRRVLVTGHTGFKGAWLSLWLQQLGAEVSGYALAAPTQPSLFELAKAGSAMTSVIGDVRDGELLKKTVASMRPEIVLHLAAQSLVHAGYADPAGTYATNVMGTVNLLEAVRHCPGIRAVVNVTTDKCYENREWVWSYRESDALGGRDPYSNSKACSELVTSAFRDSYFSADKHSQHGVALGSARAGNVIGGGDWAADRLIPDMLRAFERGEPALIRRPQAIRPWQHVLEPLHGYLLLAQALAQQGMAYAEGWNFAPEEDDARPVKWIADRLTQLMGGGAAWVTDGAQHPHEAHVLKLSHAKARARLGWRPRLALDTALTWTADWHRQRAQGVPARALCETQIAAYTRLGDA